MTQNLTVEIIPILSDNYSYIIYDSTNSKEQQVIVVDPALSDPIIDICNKNNWQVSHILNTHHHYDHIDGNDGIIAYFNAQLIGPASESKRIGNMDQLCKEGDKFKLFNEMVRVIETPGHTLGHIVFYFETSQILFAGDALFSLGCGRRFEGDPVSMWQGLEKLRTLPDETLLYCGHEYTENNIKYLRSILPNHHQLKAKEQWIKDKRSKNQPTIPSRLSEEKQLNLFLRADDQQVADALGLLNASPSDIFDALRRGKDNF